MTEEKRFEGVIVFWIQAQPDDEDIATMLGNVRTMNQSLADQMLAEGCRFLFAPTFDESTHIERINCDGEDKGILTLYVNFDPETDVDVFKISTLIRDFNKAEFDFIEQEGRFKVLIVPTTNEGSRIQRVEWDQPFPKLGEN